MCLTRHVLFLMVPPASAGLQAVRKECGVCLYCSCLRHCCLPGVPYTACLLAWLGSFTDADVAGACIIAVHLQAKVGSVAWQAGQGGTAGGA